MKVTIKRRMDEDFYDVLKEAMEGSLVELTYNKEIWQKGDKEYILFYDDDYGIYTQVNIIE